MRCAFRMPCKAVLYGIALQDAEIRCKSQLRCKAVQIADGSIVRVPVHSGVVIWDGKPRTIDVHALGKERLIGMALLAGHDLAIRVRDGGAISITLIP
jgi:hypothetical protein